MAWDDLVNTYGPSSSYGNIFAEEENEDPSSDVYLGQRGVWGDLTSSAVRGVRNIFDMTGAGLDQIGVPNPLDEVAGFVGEFDISKPDVSTYYGTENPLVRGLKSIPESVITSVGTAAEGAVLGGLATGGNPLGMAAGGLASLTLNFGAGIYKQKYDEYLEKNPFDYKGADEYGKSQAIPELGWEIASNALAIGTFGGSKLVTSLAKEGVEATARSLLSTSAKSLIGKSLIAGGVETASEELTYYNQASADEKYGMGQGPNLDGFIETAAASMGMSLLFGGVGSKYTIDQQRTLLDSLQSGNKELQAKASDLVFKQIQSNGDTDLANAWRVYADSYTNAETTVPINLDDNIIEVARKVKNEGVTLQDITSDNPSVQKNAVDKILQSAGVDPITGPDVEEINELNSLNAFETRYAGEFAGDALAYNQQRNLGTKESRRQREILEGRQDLERKQAERDSVAAATEDPVKALERIYQDNMPWETMASLGEDTYDASDTDNYKFRRDLLESKREMDALTQEDLQYREGVAAEKFGEKALEEQKEKNKPDKQQTIKFEMDRLMRELEEDSNNLTEEAKEKVNSQVVEVAMSSARRGDMKLLNYIKKQELDRVNISTGVLGIFLTPQERLELKRAKTTKSKAVKGSKKHREAVATVKVLEKKATTTPKVEVTPALSSSAQSIMEETREELKNKPVTSELFTAAEEGEAVRAIGVKDEDGSLIAPHVAEIEGKEIASGKKLTDEKNLDFTSGNDTILPSKNKVEGGPVKAVDTSGNADDVINEVATKSKSPLLKAILTGSPKDIYREIKGISNRDKLGVLTDALEEVPIEVGSLYSDVIQPRVKLAMEIISPADSDGVKASDAIFWNRREESGNYQVGHHKEIDQVAKIIKKKDGYAVYLDKDLVGTVKTIKEARVLANERAVPLSEEGKKRVRGKNVLNEEQRKKAQELGKKINEKPKGGPTTAVESDTAKPAESELESARRSLVATKEMQEKYPDQDFSKIITKWENKIAELEAEESNEALIRRTPEQRAKAEQEGRTAYDTTKTGKKIYPLSDRATALLEENDNNLQKTLDKIKAKGPNFTQEEKDDIKVLNERLGNRENYLKNITDKFPDASTILDLVIKEGSASGVGKIGNVQSILARVIKSVVSKEKLKGIKIEAADLSSSSRYNSNDNKIYLTDDSTLVAFHELIHALTVREYLSLDKNSPLVKKLNSLMRALREHSLERGLITQEQLDVLDSLETSKDFKNNLDNFHVESKDQTAILYALLNPKEFLSMAFSDKVVLNTLAEIPVTGVNRTNSIKTMFDNFIKFIRDLLGIPVGERTALEETIRSGIKLIKSNSFEIEMEESEAAPTTTSFVEDEIKKYKKLDDERTIKEKARDVLKSTEKLISEVFQPVYEALSNISKPLAEKVRHMDFLINRETTARTNLSSPFVRKYRMLTKEQTEEISFLLNNYDSEDAKNLLNSKLATLGKQSKTKGIDKDFKNIVTMLKEIDDQADTFGLKKFASVDFYFPRRVSNYDDLVAYLRNKNYKSKVENLVKKNEILELRGFLKKEGLLEETKTFLDDKNYTGLVAYLDNRSDWGVIDEAVKEAEDKAAKSGDVLTDSQRAEVVSNMLRVGRMPSAYLRTPAGTKKRSISSVNAEMMQFYHDPIEALGMHIREMTERIEINRMLGITKNKELNKSISDKVKEIEKADSQEKRTTLIKELIALENKIPAMTALIDEGIGKILDEEVKKRSITSDNQKRAKELIRARITQVGTNKFFSGVRQLALLGSLTQLSTGLRNITDNVWGMFLYGSTNQISSLIDTAARTRFSWKGRKWYDPDVTVTGKNIKELGLSFDAPLREYSTMNNVVDKAIRASGLMLVDKISKIATMEAALKKFSKMSEEGFDRKFSEIFGKETAQVYKDIKEKNITKNVEYLLFSEIANFQPIALSETSQRFLTGGNWRIAYLLKSYSIHSASNFYRESVQKVREGIKEKDNDKIKLGFKNLTLLGTLFIAIGASDDWLIDWFNGKEPDFTDSMIETLLTLAITSKYTIDRSKQDGLVGGYMETLLPPTGLFDLPFKDFMSLLEGEPTFKSIKMFPGIGTLYFNRATEEGQKNIINNHKRLLYEEYKEDFKIPSDGVRKVNKRIKEFNQRFKPEEEISTLTPGTFSSIRTKELKKK